MAMLQALTANRLRDGQVVFLTRTSGWAGQLAQAALADSDAAAAQLLASGQAAEQRCEVVGPYLIEVRSQDDQIVAAELRERIRATGPTIDGSFV